ncbi:hypothetical protein E4T66_08410 [Sinimarinibacterium sp. CAU 1509]|uniref:hypothetical protein n=1 Tax=Sinimarinibacterium sp. CAU 1509 TaxID=2562283 RepID=UPI0010AD88E3|nr:hypothetical protein [Sinimarinibacterium sp. CAU 1509]TJY62234.1 hypothetical protein E4T66_08410 [Sinimarinibacterium sp. CAU 1509]
MKPLVEGQTPHLSLCVADVDASLEEFSRQLGCAPCFFVSGEFALWQTQDFNVSIRRGGLSTSAVDQAWARFTTQPQMHDSLGLRPGHRKEIH